MNHVRYPCSSLCLYHRHWISLHLVVRLMFCLQPTDDNWNFPEFPYLHSNSHEEDINIDLNSSYCCLSWPVADNIPEKHYSDSVRKSQKLSGQLWVLFLLFRYLFDFKISDQDNAPSNFIARILSRSASQYADIVQVLMVCEIALFVRPIDMAHRKVLIVFDLATLDDDTVSRTARRVDESRYCKPSLHWIVHGYPVIYARATTLGKKGYSTAKMMSEKLGSIQRGVVEHRW